MALPISSLMKPASNLSSTPLLVLWSAGWENRIHPQDVHGVEEGATVLWTPSVQLFYLSQQIWFLKIMPWSFVHTGLRKWALSHLIAILIIHLQADVNRSNILTMKEGHYVVEVLHVEVGMREPRLEIPSLCWPPGQPLGCAGYDFPHTPRRATELALQVVIGHILLLLAEGVLAYITEEETSCQICIFPFLEVKIHIKLIITIVYIFNSSKMRTGWWKPPALPPTHAQTYTGSETL